MNTIHRGYISRILTEGYLYITETNDKEECIHTYFCNLRAAKEYKGLSPKELDIRKNNKVAFTIDDADNIVQIVIFRSPRFKVFKPIYNLSFFIIGFDFLMCRFSK
jgi:hypothetical protein